MVSAVVIILTTWLCQKIRGSEFYSFSLKDIQYFKSKKRLKDKKETRTKKKGWGEKNV